MFVPSREPAAETDAVILAIDDDSDDDLPIGRLAHMEAAKAEAAKAETLANEQAAAAKQEQEEAAAEAAAAADAAAAAEAAARQ